MHPLLSILNELLTIYESFAESITVLKHYWKQKVLKVELNWNRNYTIEFLLKVKTLYWIEIEYGSYMQQLHWILFNSSKILSHKYYSILLILQLLVVLMPRFIKGLIIPVSYIFVINIPWFNYTISNFIYRRYRPKYSFYKRGMLTHKVLLFVTHWHGLVIWHIQTESKLHG